jgi:hypothetical protein
MVEVVCDVDSCGELGLVDLRENSYMRAEGAGMRS